jgi:DNA-binding response OmpR family regulator
MSNPASILIVDDEPNVRLILADTLTLSGYSVVSAGSVREALEEVRQHNFDVAILDLAVAQENGMTVAQAIRQQTPYTALIILTGQGNLKSAIEAIEMNAQSYLLKPVTPQQLRENVALQVASMADRRQRDELAAHMRAAIDIMQDARPAKQTDKRPIQSGSLHIDPVRRRTSFHGQSLDLTDAEFDLLFTLARSEGETLDAKTLVCSALGYITSDIEARELVKSHISHLRHKLEPEPTRPRHILTVRGKGYMWAPD